MRKEIEYITDIFLFVLISRALHENSQYTGLEESQRDTNYVFALHVLNVICLEMDALVESDTRLRIDKSVFQIGWEFTRERGTSLRRPAGYLGTSKIRSALCLFPVAV